MCPQIPQFAATAVAHLLSYDAMFDDKKHGIVQGPVSTHAGARPLF